MKNNIKLLVICILCTIKGVAQSSKSILSFPNAFIYEVGNGIEKSEIWIYHNPTNGQYLYVPNDDMVKAVLGTPEGIYTIFTETEKGEKMAIKQKIYQVLEKSDKHKLLKSINQTQKIDGSQGQIIAKGFTLSYLKTAEVDTLFLSTQIFGNANILYGFSLLEGDIKLSHTFNLCGIVPKNQFITHYFSKYSSVKLLTYENNPYQFEVKHYKFKQVK